jgi:hypothetical protein
MTYRIPIPPSMDAEAWEAFLRMRRRMKKPIDDAAEPELARRAQQKHLVRWAEIKAAGYDANECVWTACSERWLMFYPPKDAPIERLASSQADATKRMLDDLAARPSGAPREVVDRLRKLRVVR